MALDATDLLAHMDAGFNSIRTELRELRRESSVSADAMHGRITGVEKQIVAHTAAPCTDAHPNSHRNGNSNGRQPYPAAVQQTSDTFRAGSNAVWKIAGLVLAVSVGAIGAAAGLIKLMEFILTR